MTEMKTNKQTNQQEKLIWFNIKENYIEMHIWIIYLCWTFFERCAANAIVKYIIRVKTNSVKQMLSNTNSKRKISG